MKQSLVNIKWYQKTEIQETTYNIIYRERGSHVRRIYSTRYTLRAITARVKQEEEVYTQRIIVNEKYVLWKEGT